MDPPIGTFSLSPPPLLYFFPSPFFLMSNCKLVIFPPDRPNIYYEVFHRQDSIKDDLESLCSQLKVDLINMPRIIIYFRYLHPFLFIFFLHVRSATSMLKHFSSAYYVRIMLASSPGSQEGGGESLLSYTVYRTFCKVM